MIRKTISCALAAFTLCTIASIHMTDPAKAAGKYCKPGHFHYGNSENISRKRAAMIAAVRSWTSFTFMEYGSSYASFRKSANRSVKCERAGLNGSWSCEAKGRPCRS